MKSQINLAIDGNEANVENRVGSNVYAFEVLSELERQTRKNSSINSIILLTTHPHADMPSQRPGWKYRVIRPAFLWTQWALPRYLYAHKNEFNLFFTPGHYAPRNSPVPYVSSVMDLAFLSHPSYFTLKDRLQLKYWTKYSVENAKKILTISEASKKEIISRFGRSSKDIIVGYPAVTEKPKLSADEAEKICKRLGAKQPFILSIGTLQPRKNLIRLIEAFEIVVRREAASPPKATRKKPAPLPISLVLAGKQGWMAEPIIERIKKSPYADRILLTGFVDDSEKWALLERAKVTAVVGLAEGFGIPALEALQAGSIPVVSNISSLPEVVGSAGVLIDPTNSLNMADGLWKGMTLTARERAVYRRKAREQCKTFSWKETVEKILEALLNS